MTHFSDIPFIGVLLPDILVKLHLISSEAQFDRGEDVVMCQV